MYYFPSNTDGNESDTEFKTSIQLLIFWNQKEQSMRFHLFFFSIRFASPSDGICKFLLPYDFHHNIYSLYYIILIFTTTVAFWANITVVLFITIEAP